ncbi:ABC transporter permease [Bacillus sp. NMCC46]|uniref:ABC transporter permease n=1 Tax=Bacillus TaxID=1386 RepID=UPI000BA54D77|nr:MULTISPECIES: ABC transporter permease [Bacillus]PAC81351.1 ABC transporter permease [Bacillus sp. 7788]PRS43095.1 ABC transporter permease [Bacillus sp. NMCC46]QNP15830.1 ABC transporter permease [Bacillus pumilus]
MTFIKHIFKLMKKELLYQYYAKTFLILFIPLMLISLWNVYAQYETTKSNYAQYVKTESEYKELGIDIKKALTMPVNIEEGELAGAEGEVVENVLKYDYEKFIQSLHLMEPTQVISTNLEWMGFIFYPLVFGLYAIYLATYDVKYKTMKIKAVQYQWNDVLFSKQLSLYVIILFLIPILSLISYMASHIFYSVISKDISVQLFTYKDSTEHSILLQLMFVVCTSWLFSTLVFYLGSLCRSFILSVVIYMVYFLLIPNLGVFDLKNMIANLALHLFSFKGNYQLFVPIPMNITTILICISLLICLSSLLTYTMVKRQSKYVV